MSAIQGRALGRGELDALWTIDRSEVIDAMYRVAEGELVLRAEHHDVRGWPPGEAEKYGPLLADCHDRGGWFHGLFEGPRLVAAAVLESRLIGARRDRLQLKFLHVGRAHRGRGLGRLLFGRAREEAARRGARSLYVSATPSARTVDFYLALGAELAAEPDAGLLALEPEDIHLECPVAQRPGEDG